MNDFISFKESYPKENQQVILRISEHHQTIATYLGDNIFDCKDMSGSIKLNLKKDFSQEDQKFLSWKPRT